VAREICVVFVAFAAKRFCLFLRPSVEVGKRNVWDGAMNYRGFLIEAFEQAPGQWRARISRPHRRPLKSIRRGLREFITGVDQSSAAAALTMAMEAIDTDPLFHPKAEARAERFWRLGAQSVRAPVPET
jgi:hypothetical protein